MITNLQLKEGFLKKHSREITPEELNTFQELMITYECSDSDSYEEAFQKIQISLKLKKLNE